MQESDIQSVKAFLIDLQSRICEALEQEDGKGKFITDQWNRPEGGGGISRVLTDGAIIEKGGVNFSHVFGDNLPASASAHRPEIAGRAFQAMGISLVIHPKNPMAPTSHANVRLFVATKAGEAPIWWFGGGYDLTPYYLFEDDAIHWHQTAKAACDRFSDDYYPRFKAWCDDYFFLKHRAEARGIGGLFFDDINENSFEHCFSFIRSIGNSFIPAYLPILQKRHSMRFTEQQRDYQLHRRGRYVEFNLVFDRGTLFGLQSGGRTESILMSLPPIVKWDYNWQVSADSDEQKLLDVLQNPREWIEQS